MPLLNQEELAYTAAYVGWLLCPLPEIRWKFLESTIREACCAVGLAFEWLWDVPLSMLKDLSSMEGGTTTGVFAYICTAEGIRLPQVNCHTVLATLLMWGKHILDERMLPRLALGTF